MPLIKSSSRDAIGKNIATEIAAGKPRRQAIAIGLDVARRAKRADGGGVFTGPIVSEVPGRTDHHPMDVPSGAYVLPADHVSSLGEGNTLAGMDYIKKIGPAGIKKLISKHGIKSSNIRRRARGGSTGHVGSPVPIAAAGGEIVLTPEEVTQIGDGDLDRGHAMLDAWVVANRKKHIKTLKNLPGPAQD